MTNLQTSVLAGAFVFSAFAEWLSRFLNRGGGKR
jgi:hypothetical protein